jgi:hypothetical protein
VYSGEVLGINPESLVKATKKYKNRIRPQDFPRIGQGAIEVLSAYINGIQKEAGSTEVENFSEGSTITDSTAQEGETESTEAEFVRGDLDTYKKVKIASRRRRPDRVRFYGGKNNIAVSTAALKGLERQVKRYLQEKPEASEEEAIIAIQKNNGKRKRVSNWHSSTIRRIIQEVRLNEQE